MNCTGDSSTERLLGQCNGGLSSRFVEVRAFSSSRPHGGLCYGPAKARLRLDTQAKGRISPAGRETCSVSVSGRLQRGADQTVWRVYVHHLCLLLKVRSETWRERVRVSLVSRGKNIKKNNCNLYIHFNSNAF